MAEPKDQSPARLERYLKAIVAFGRVAAERVSEDHLLQRAVVTVSRAIDVDRIKVLRYRRDRGDLLIRAGIGWTPGVVDVATVPTDMSSPGGRALQTKRANIISDMANEPEYRYSQLLREHRIVSLINAPILVDGETWGVLEVDSDQSRQFDEHDTNFILAIAQSLGMALERMNLEDRGLRDLAKAERRAKQRELLLREAQHRVRNNFQIIHSLLGVQRRRVTDPEARQAFESVLTRVAAISLAHDQLAVESDTGAIDLAVYLNALCQNLSQQAGVHIDVQVASVQIGVDHAVPLGLIVNEAVTNAIKYAFDAKKPGTIEVRLSVNPAWEEGCLEVTDNGKGMGPNREESSGMQLMEGLAEQVGGSFDCASSDQGTSIRVTFPVPQAAHRRDGA